MLSVMIMYIEISRDLGINEIFHFFLEAIYNSLECPKPLDVWHILFAIRTNHEPIKSHEWMKESWERGAYFGLKFIRASTYITPSAMVSSKNSRIYCSHMGA